MRAWEKNIRRVEPYVPGEQPKVDNVIKLNTNENPYPPAPKAYEAAKAFDMDKLRLYPDPECSALVHSIAQYYGMDDNEVFTGVGYVDVLAVINFYGVGSVRLNLIDAFFGKVRKIGGVGSNRDQITV